MSNLTQLLSEYLAFVHGPECIPDDDGVFTFDAGQGLLVCASEFEDSVLELFASPGYMSGAEMASMCELVGEDGDEADDDGVLEHWQAHGAAWSVELDRKTGLVTLTGIWFEAPWDLDGFMSAVDALREIYVGWTARLQCGPDPLTAFKPADSQVSMEGTFLRA